MGTEADNHSGVFLKGDENKPRSRPPRRVTPPTEDAPAIEDSETPNRTSVFSRPRRDTEYCDHLDFEASWSPKFSLRRTLHDDRVLVEIRKDLDADGDELDIFCADSGDTASRCAVEVIGKFCRHIKLEDVVRRRDRAGQFRNVWLNEKCCIPELKGRGESRENNNPLTSFGAYNALRRQRYNHKGLVDAARRLIYVSDLDPACIHALAATASCHQAPVLRDAIYQHLHFQTSIAVSFPTAGFLTFTLALHLPFFLLRDTPPDEPENTTYTKPRRTWTDLAFLGLDDEEAQAQEPKKAWGMWEAHISCVVTGTDDWRWVCYGFVDAEIDGLLHESSEDDLDMDQIALGCLDANVPIWRPRDYWLKVFEIRIDQVMREWEILVHKIELGIYRYTQKHSFTLARRCGIAAEEDAEIKEAFDWTVQAMGLLRRIDSALSNTVDAWHAFSAHDGDIGYFRPTPEASISPNARRSLHTIRAIFRKLEGTQKKIYRLDKCCSQFKENLQLRLFVAGKETADGNETTSEFMASVLYPFALAAAIFSVQQQALPFDLNPRSFIITSVLMPIIVYSSRLLVPYILSRWRLFRRAAISWLYTSRNEKKQIDVVVQSRSRTVGDEERDALGTRVLRRSPAADFRSKAG